ncbi:hypothetical protein ACOMHN_041891 [Nucella lapillus]
MDPASENSSDSIEVAFLSDVPGIGTGIPTEVTVSDPNGVLVGTLPPLPIENHSHQQQPRAVIVEQPQQRGFRFRYECEGPSHGGLQGVSSERSHKTHPAIRGISSEHSRKTCPTIKLIENYDGPAIIQVSLVTDENSPRIHAHKLVGKNCSGGICKVEVNSTAGEISFPNLCILHVTRKKAAEVLMNRILEDVKLHKSLLKGSSAAQTTAEESQQAKKQASEQSQNMALNVVRLQFRVVLLSKARQMISMLPPVVSQSIYDSKSPGASTLKICRMDKYGGCCTGNEEVFLLCEKVQKEDIAVRFVETNPDGSVKWEAYGNFSPLDVHRQYAIVFKTPAYYNANIDKAVNVMIMLQRKSDADVSEAKAFTYYPQNRDKDLIARKKRKKLPLDSSFNYYGGGDDGPPGPDGGMGGGYGGAPPGSGGLGGGGGGVNGSGGGVGNGGSYSVILPNGTVMDHMNALPATVEQVVKEEFDRCNLESSESRSSAADSASPMASPYDPMLWNGDINDLETDAAPSLRHPSQIPLVTSAATPTKQSHISSNFPPETPPTDPAAPVAKQSQILSDFSPETTPTDNRTATQEKSRMEKDVLDTNNPTQGKVPLDRSFKPASSRNTTLVTSSKDASNVAASIKTSLAAADRQKDTVVDKGRSSMQTLVSSLEDSTLVERCARSVASDVIPSPTKSSEVSVWSEGHRTDEGFSEVSEEVSVREETSVKKAESETPPATRQKRKSGKGETKEKSDTSLKTATQVVKRVMERITTRTVRALQDFSETGDCRYLLIVQRHLTAFKNENGDLPIHLAVINNQTSSLCHLLDVMTSLHNACRSVNAYNYMRQTALHLAAIMRQPIHIELLLHAGANPSLADRNGNTPAHLAVLNNSVEALSSLIKYLRPGVMAANPFPELNYLNYDGYSPVHLASQVGNMDIQYTHTPPPSHPPPSPPLQNTHTSEVNPCVSDRLQPGSPGIPGYSPVHLAAQVGNVDILRLLVHGKANVNMADGKSGRTALHHAVEQDDLPVAGFLLMEANAEVNARCFDGNTPLHIACCRGLMGMVALLMTVGAQADIENEEIPPGNGSDSEEEAGGEETSYKCRRGLVPCDYAAGKDRLQIMVMLTGDGYLSDGEEEEGHHSNDENDNDLEEDTGASMTYKSTCDSGVAVSLTSQSDRSATNLPVENKLSDEVHLELCKLLDQVNRGKDVFALASCLGYDSLVNTLEIMGCVGSSPTQYLLNYHETYGTISQLKECLRSMQREDAVRLINRPVTGGGGEGWNSGSQKSIQPQEPRNVGGSCKPVLTVGDLKVVYVAQEILWIKQEMAHKRFPLFSPVIQMYQEGEGRAGTPAARNPFSPKSRETSEAAASRF